MLSLSDIQKYIKNYSKFNKNIIYDFNINDGGVADYIKYFMYLLQYCMNKNFRLYYKKNGLPLESYIPLQFSELYISQDKINNFKILNSLTSVDTLENINNNMHYICKPNCMYKKFDFDFINLKFGDVFYFSDEVISNKKNIYSDNLLNYISIHLRLGDKHLELEKKDKKFVYTKWDQREFNYDKLSDLIIKNKKKIILFFCDNYSFKQKIKKKYPFIKISSAKVGHTGLSISSKREVLDAASELALLAGSKEIYSASYSGFPLVAGKLGEVKVHKLHNQKDLTN